MTSCKLGCQDPTISVHPECAGSRWEQVHALNARAGLEMVQWQDTVMRHWTGVTPAGKWASPVACLSLARQNGKTLGTVEARANWGMLALGERVIYTAHLQKTSTETFEEMASFFDTPKLRKYVKNIRTALGRERIELKPRRGRGGADIPGGSIKFLARTRAGGRGHHGDLLIFDEALFLSRESQGSFLPVLIASRNPQTIYTSSPPAVDSDSEVWRELRAGALSDGLAGIAWDEWSVPEIGDVADRARWYATNPSMGHFIDEDTIAAELLQLDPMTFAIEQLGYWHEPKRRAKGDKELLFDAADWAACECLESPDGRIGYGVKFTSDGEAVSLAACIVDADGDPYVELLANEGLHRGTGWLADFLVREWRAACSVVIDGRAGAQQLVDELLRRGVAKRAIVQPRSADVISAAAGFLNAVRQHEVAHIEQEELTARIAGAVKRRIGTDGGWGFADKDGDDASPLEAAALAYWGAINSRRRPGRKQRLL